MGSKRALACRPRRNSLFCPPISIAAGRHAPIGLAVEPRRDARIRQGGLYPGNAPRVCRGISAPSLRDPAPLVRCRVARRRICPACPSSSFLPADQWRSDQTRYLFPNRPIATRSCLSITFPAIRCLTSPGTRPLNCPKWGKFGIFLSIGAIVKTKLTIFAKNNFHKKMVQVVAFVGEFNRDLGLMT